RGVGAAVGLGHGHARPLGPALAVAGQEALLLLGGPGGLDGGAAEAGPGRAEVDAGVAPGERLDDVHEGLRGEAAGVALARRPRAEAVAGAPGLVPHRAHELPGHLVLVVVEVAGAGAHVRPGHLLDEPQALADRLRRLERDHQTM